MCVIGLKELEIATEKALIVFINKWRLLLS